MSASRSRRRARSPSLAAGQLVTIEVGPSLADGLTGNLDPETITLDIVRAAVDEVVLVDEIFAAQRPCGELDRAKSA